MRGAAGIAARRGGSARRISAADLPLQPGHLVALEAGQNGEFSPA